MSAETKREMMAAYQAERDAVLGMHAVASNGCELPKMVLLMLKAQFKQHALLTKIVDHINSECRPTPPPPDLGALAEKVAEWEGRK